MCVCVFFYLKKKITRAGRKAEEGEMGEAVEERKEESRKNGRESTSNIPRCQEAVLIWEEIN